jgi:hypothetical protein
MADFDEKGFQEISKSNMERLSRLAQMGVQIGGINEGYVARLLEHLVGSEEVRRLKMEQQLWIADQLDNHEKVIRERQLLIGAGDPSALTR